MQTLWPDPDAYELTDSALEQLYDYPAELDRPFVQVNFVSSLDGAVTVAGRSAELSGPGDQKVFHLQRDLADVILVGATTALIERYRGLKRNEVRAERRERLGLAPLPPVAVVTGKCSITPDSLLITDTLVPPILFTSEAAPGKQALTDAGAEVVVVGDEHVDLNLALAELGKRGLNRVNCEGGPRLFGGMIAANLVDQLNLTLSPQLTAGDSGRISAGPVLAEARRMRLAAALRDDDFLMLAYRR
ncbi:pyrimidine reductase family protein [Kibdelosporangium philippinense]|uniref:Pyrimidine reductase family protein n=1 Tax=Kibdelosporangium philippinense TaxID=211113 RepID=A0ABS8ZPR5_9PSEU|nr:pyrimidine reductase family protein [Kibdelosporangium philippinense]MCE7009741.1 pyrimidine reductase family protein [Kibdelosporangium philippinense]